MTAMSLRFVSRWSSMALLSWALVVGSNVLVCHAFSGPTVLQQRQRSLRNHQDPVGYQRTVFKSTVSSKEVESATGRDQYVKEAESMENAPSTEDTLSKMGDLTLQMENTESTDLQQETSQEEYNRGLLTVGFITLLFASNSPVLHTVFSDSATSPPVLMINAAVSVVALTGLLFGGSTLESNTRLPSSLLRNLDQAKHDEQKQKLQELQAGAELGLWKFLGTTANIYGLSLTSASHGAFLIQLTTLIVPVVQGIMGVPIPKRIQFSVVLALAGVFLFTQDAITTAGGNTQDILAQGLNSQAAMGDALCVLAAVFYATYDLRLFSWGKRVVPRKLITNKIATQAIFSLVLLAVCGWGETADFFTSLGDDMSSVLLPLASVVLWSGVAVNAVAPFLQVGGQQAVGPTRAQTLYASQPLWASIMSYVCLGETVGIKGFIGGAAFLTALGLAATTEAPDPDCGQEICEV